MKTQRFIFYSVIAIAVLIVLVLWHGKKQSAKTPIVLVETNASLAANTASAPAIITVHTNESSAQVVANATALPQENKGEQIKQGLSKLNDSQIVFYGKLEDQFGNSLGNTVVNFSIRVYNGVRSGVDKGQVTSDANGLFTISGCNGESLSVVPQKRGYALASLNGGGIYSYMWPDAQRAHPDPNSPVIIKMWKLNGAEPLVGINKEYKIQYTNNPIYFDLAAGIIVPSGGDIKITVNRPQGIVSEHNPQDWGFTIEAVDGGLIETDSRESQITYAAPESGYQQSDTLTASANKHGIGLIQQMFFVQSRNGQIYSKLGLSFSINDTPDGFMYIRFRGVANTNGSRNWEDDPNTLKTGQ